MPSPLLSMMPTSDLHPIRKSELCLIKIQVDEWSQVWIMWPGSEPLVVSCMSLDTVAGDVFLTSVCWRPRTRCQTTVVFTTNGTDLTTFKFVGPPVQDHFAAALSFIKLWFLFAYISILEESLREATQKINPANNVHHIICLNILLNYQIYISLSLTLVWLTHISTWCSMSGINHFGILLIWKLENPSDQFSSFSSVAGEITYSC